MLLFPWKRMFCLYLHILGEYQRPARILDDALLRSSAAIIGAQKSDLRERRERMALAGLYIDLHAGTLPQRYLIATQFKKMGTLNRLCWNRCRAPAFVPRLGLEILGGAGVAFVRACPGPITEGDDRCRDFR